MENDEETSVESLDIDLNKAANLYGKKDDFINKFQNFDYTDKSSIGNAIQGIGEVAEVAGIGKALDDTFSDAKKGLAVGAAVGGVLAGFAPIGTALAPFAPIVGAAVGAVFGLVKDIKDALKPKPLPEIYANLQAYEFYLYYKCRAAIEGWGGGGSDIPRIRAGNAAWFTYSQDINVVLADLTGNGKMANDFENFKKRTGRWIILELFYQKLMKNHQQAIKDMYTFGVGWCKVRVSESENLIYNPDNTVNGVRYGNNWGGANNEPYPRLGAYWFLPEISNIEKACDHHAKIMFFWSVIQANASFDRVPEHGFYFCPYNFSATNAELQALNKETRGKIYDLVGASLNSYTSESDQQKPKKWYETPVAIVSASVLGLFLLYYFFIRKPKKQE